MYQDKFVVAIKAGGKILRETKDLVKLPFGSEFSVLVKNLNSRRAKFTLHIDGQDVLDGTEIIVDANSEVEMKRFIRNGNMDEGNAFKFIERTKAIEDGPRGIKVDDGVVRVEFWFEQAAPVVTTTTHYHTDVWWSEYYRQPRPYWTYYNGPYYGSVTSTSGTINNVADVKLGDNKSPSILRGVALNSANQVFTSNAATLTSNASATSATFSADTVNSTPTMDSFTPEENEIGITVPGSKVEQKFSTVYGFNSEKHSNVIVIRLVGMVGTVEVTAPITVKTKQKCTTCGKVNKANAKFCSECGTSLELV